MAVYCHVDIDLSCLYVVCVNICYVVLHLSLFIFVLWLYICHVCLSVCLSCGGMYTCCVWTSNMWFSICHVYVCHVVIHLFCFHVVCGHLLGTPSVMCIFVVLLYIFSCGSPPVMYICLCHMVVHLSCVRLSQVNVDQYLC